MRKLLFIVTGFLFLSCSGNGDQYVGRWENGNYYVLVKKAGDGYFIFEKTQYNKNYRGYCEFEGGCFIDENDGVHYEIICDDSKGGIISVISGRSYKRMKL
jgi:hypothetical protein